MTINITDLQKVEMCVGTVLHAERVPGTDKLLKLSVDMGEEIPRSIISGIAEHVSPEELVQRQFCFVANLEPRVIRGLESQGMILATGEGSSFSLMSPTERVSPGSRLR